MEVLHGGGKVFDSVLGWFKEIGKTLNADFLQKCQPTEPHWKDSDLDIVTEFELLQKWKVGETERDLKQSIVAEIDGLQGCCLKLMRQILQQVVREVEPRQGSRTLFDNGELGEVVATQVKADDAWKLKQDTRNPCEEVIMEFQLGNLRKRNQDV